MATRTTTRKTAKQAAPVTTNTDLKDLSLQLLTPDQFEAVTKANYYHPDSKLVLHLFLYVNYIWQISRKLQNDPSSVNAIDWPLVEKNTAKLISDSLSRLLSGIDTKPWTKDLTASKSSSKLTRNSVTLAPKQSCGCRFKHSDAAGVVEACELGRAQGQDETWTGY